MSAIIGYIILTIGIAITLYNIYATATLKKRNEGNRVKYNLMFAPLESALLEKQKEYNCSFKSVTRVVTDREEPVVIVADYKKKIAAVAVRDYIEVFPFESLKNVEINQEEKTNNISVHITLSDKTLTYPIATKEYRKISMQRKLCLDMANSFVEALRFEEKKEGNNKRKAKR